MVTRTLMSLAVGAGARAAEHFVSRAALDTKGGQKQIDDYWTLNLIRTPQDIFAARFENDPPEIWQYTSGSKDKINTLKDSARKLFMLLKVVKQLTLTALCCARHSPYWRTSAQLLSVTICRFWP